MNIKSTTKKDLVQCLVIHGIDKSQLVNMAIEKVVRMINVKVMLCLIF